METCRCISGTNWLHRESETGCSRPGSPIQALRWLSGPQSQPPNSGLRTLDRPEGSPGKNTLFLTIKALLSLTTCQFCPSLIPHIFPILPISLPYLIAVWRPNTPSTSLRKPTQPGFCSLQSSRRPPCQFLCPNSVYRCICLQPQFDQAS